MSSPALRYLPVVEDDFEALLALRISAMRASLERIGRFDPERARARFRQRFSPPHTRHIVFQDSKIGFHTLRPDQDGLLLDHLYLLPQVQGQGIGSAVLTELFRQADAAALPLRVGALRDSDANRFYLRHGFVQTAETEWDIYYVRACIPVTGTD